MRQVLIVMVWTGFLTGVAASAADDDSAKAPAPTPAPAPIESFTAEQKSHWAYQPVHAVELPAVKKPGWARNPIDHFVQSAREEQEFACAPEASKIDLLRRVTFDLTGLPPTPAESAAFLDDASPEAYERLVDRLLASPRFGERWAQHWLDLAHYADTNGFELDAERPDAWRYRDWVIKALNDDMPYDQFTRLQLAGDEERPGDPSALIATGFGRCGPREVVSGNIDPAVRRDSELAEVTGTVGSVFLGLTIGCARCHDHKFDALPTTDYYRLRSFFAAAQFVEKPIAPKSVEQAYEAACKAIDARIAPLRAAQSKLEEPYRKRLSDEKRSMLSPKEKAIMAIPEKERTKQQTKIINGLNAALQVRWEEVAEAVRANPADERTREELKRSISDLEKQKPEPPAKAMALLDEATEAPASFVLKRGDPKNQGASVAPRPPGIMLAHQVSGAFPEAIPPGQTTTGRRLELARWLTRSDNPLTARVIVNRLWQHHFGRGLVATPSDFGVRGEAPSHPELLDWLAARLVREGWRLKPIHRLMVTSATYRMSSRYRNDQQEKDDPDNLFLWHMNRRRMDAESLRDAFLAASGELNPRMGGPGVRAPIEREVEDLIFTEFEVVDLWPETPDSSEHLRRSIYLYRKRNVRYPMFDAFDAPDTQTACPQRVVSTHPLQALVTLNSAFALDRAKALAGRILKEAREPVENQVDHAYGLTLCRQPTSREIEQARSFLDRQSILHGERSKHGEQLGRPAGSPTDIDPARAAAWVDFALAMLNRNEFVYIP